VAAREWLDESKPLLIKVSWGQSVTASELEQLRAMVDSDDELIVALGAWALGTTGDVASLPTLERRWPKDPLNLRISDSSYEDPMLRIAILKLRSRSPEEDRRIWAHLLLADAGPMVRGEAAKALVRIRHPEALKLLCQAVEEDKYPRQDGGAPFYIGLAQALGRLGRRETVPCLTALLGRGGQVHDVSDQMVLNLERCHSFGDTPCRSASMEDSSPGTSVSAYAERAFHQLTGRRPWGYDEFPRVLARIGRTRSATSEERWMLRQMVHAADWGMAARAAWALGYLHDRDAAADMERARARVMAKRVETREWQGAGVSLEARQEQEGKLRLAAMRARPLSRPAEWRRWERLLLEDENPLIRGEAAKEIVAIRHPRRQQLLSRAVQLEARNQPEARATVLSQIAVALGRMPGKGSGRQLEAMLGIGDRVPRAVVSYLQFEPDQPATDLPEADYSIDAYARRALAKLHGGMRGASQGP
jgi:hypothetical protein